MLSYIGGKLFCQSTALVRSNASYFTREMEPANDSLTLLFRFSLRPLSNLIAKSLWLNGSFLLFFKQFLLKTNNPSPKVTLTK